MVTTMRTLSRIVDTSGTMNRAYPSAPVVATEPMGALSPVNFVQSIVASAIASFFDERTLTVKVRFDVMFVGCVAFWHDANISTARTQNSEVVRIRVMFTTPNARIHAGEQRERCLYSLDKRPDIQRKACEG